MNPRVQAILIADHVYEDKATGKKVVAGIFDKLVFANKGQFQQSLRNQLEAKGVKGADRHIPGGLSAGSPTCYLRLTDIRKTEEFTLRYVYVNEDQVLLKTTFKIDCTDPLRAIDVVLPLPPLPSEKAGTFALELAWNNDVIGSHRVIVEEMPLGDGQEENANTD